MDSADDAKSLGERWLLAWIADAPSEDERSTREFVAGHWRTMNLDRVMHDWQELSSDRYLEYRAKHKASNQALMHLHGRHALPVWRAYLTMRDAGVAPDESLSLKFDQWARRLIDFDRRAAGQRLPPDSELLRFEAVYGSVGSDEGKAVLKLLDFAGSGGRQKSLGRLREAERRRKAATEIHRLRTGGLAFSAIASRMGISVQTAKELRGEFVPSVRARTSADKRATARESGQALAAVFRQRREKIK